MVNIFPPVIKHRTAVLRNVVLSIDVGYCCTIKLQWRESSRWLTTSTPSSDHRWEIPLCALSSCQISTVEYRAPNSMYLSSFVVTLKLLQVNAAMTCELREKKQLPTMVLQSSRKIRVMTSRVQGHLLSFIM